MTPFDRAKEISKKRGYSLQDTAIKAGLSKNAIYRWKTTTPSKISIKAVADVLGVSVDYLLGNTDEMYPAQSNENKTADLKKIMDEFSVLQFDGKDIPEEDLPVIERIIKGLLDERG